MDLNQLAILREAWLKDAAEQGGDPFALDSFANYAVACTELHESILKQIPLQLVELKMQNVSGGGVLLTTCTGKPILLVIAGDVVMVKTKLEQKPLPPNQTFTISRGFEGELGGPS